MNKVMYLNSCSPQIDTALDLGLHFFTSCPLNNLIYQMNSTVNYYLCDICF